MLSNKILFPKKVNKLQKKSILLESFYYALPLLALGLHQYACACGISLTFDSFQYLNAAEDFAQHRAITMSDGSPFVAYPPFFPWVLSWFGENRLAWMPFFQGFLLVSNLSIWLYLGACYISSVFLRFIFGLSICLSAPFLLIHSFLWSEPLFVCLLSIIFLYFHFNNEKLDFRGLCFLLLMCGLLILQRNAGIWWSIGVLLGVLILLKHTQVYFKWILLLSIGVVLWLGWYKQSLHTDAYKHDSLFTFLQEIIENIGICAAQLGSWFLPLSVPEIVRVLLASLILGVIAWVLIKGKKSVARWILLLIIAHLIYEGGLLILKPSALHYSDLERFMAVMLPGFFLIWFYILDVFLLLYPKKIVSYSLYIVLMFSLVYPTYRSVKNTHFWKENQCKSIK